MSTIGKRFKPPFTRTRTTGAILPAKSQWTHVYTPYGGSPGAPTVGTQNTPAVMGSAKTMTDWVTPGAKLLIASGTIIQRPMSFASTSHESRYTSYKWIKVWPNGNQEEAEEWSDNYVAAMLLGKPFGPITIGQLSIDKYVKLAVIDTLAKVVPPESLSLVTAYELPKTIDLIADTARKLARLILLAKRRGSYAAAKAVVGRSFRRTRPPGSKFREELWDKFHTPTQKWLEWRYGWMPLIYDIVGTLQAMAKAEFNKPRYTARGKAKAELVHPKATYVATWYGQNTVQRDVTETLTVRGYCLYDADLTLQRWQDFGITALPESVWEVVPWSFVIDWFIPIGDWLRAASPKLGVTVKADGYTVEHQIDSVFTITAWAASPPDAFGGQWQPVGPRPIGESWRVTYRWKYRVVGLPPVSFPPIDVHLNVKRAIDAIALLRQAGRSSNLRV